MILINKNTTNKVILTLSEKTTLTNAKYLFEVTNDMSNAVKCFIAADISTNKLITLILKGNPVRLLFFYFVKV